VTDIREIENVLQTYSLQDIFEWNEVTEEDALLFLVEEGFVKLPDPEPV
jgi:hypothetical protein